MSETTASELIANFWKEHPVANGWSIETEFIPRPNNVRLTFKATIKCQDHVIVTAYSDGETSLERVEDKAIARAISMLPAQTQPSGYKLDWGKPAQNP